MAIDQYQDDSGNTLYKVTVSKRSTVNPALRLQRQKEGIKTLPEAKAIYKTLLNEAQREIWEREQAGCSWGKLVEDWGSALTTGKGLDRPVSQTTAEDNVRALEIYTDLWWKRPARDITRADVRQVIERLDAEGKSNSRKRAVKSAIHGAFMYGIENGWIKGVSQSPVTGIKISRVEEKKPDILNINEIRKLLDAAKLYGHAWYPMWACALLTGMRSGELQALLWTDVDFERRNITVSKSYNGRFKVVKCTKSGNYRDVPINSDLERLLKELRASANGRAHVLPQSTDWGRGEQARILRQFCTGIGITSVKFHALRACFATQLLRDKVAPVVVMKICGWKDLKVMQRYIRLAGIEIEGATDGLKLLPMDQAMGRVVELYKQP